MGGAMQRLVPAATLVCFALMLSFSSVIAGEIYKCKDKNGSLTYSDQPCGDNPEIVDIKEYGGGNSLDAGNRNSGSTVKPVAELQGSRDESSSQRTPAESQGRYYNPVVRSYATSGIVEETEYYIEFRDQQSTRKGIDSDRLKREHGARYLRYQSALPTCRNEMGEHLAKSEASDREIDKKGQEQDCPAGQTLEMGYKWHCYVNEKQSEAKGCEVLSCWTHFVCQ